MTTTGIPRRTAVGDRRRERDFVERREHDAGDAAADEPFDPPTPASRESSSRSGPPPDNRRARLARRLLGAGVDASARRHATSPFGMTAIVSPPALCRGPQALKASVASRNVVQAFRSAYRVVQAFRPACRTDLKPSCRADLPPSPNGFGESRRSSRVLLASGGGKVCTTNEVNAQPPQPSSRSDCRTAARCRRARRRAPGPADPRHSLRSRPLPARTPRRQCTPANPIRSSAARRRSSRRRRSEIRPDVPCRPRSQSASVTSPESFAETLAQAASARMSRSPLA